MLRSILDGSSSIITKLQLSFIRGLYIFRMYHFTHTHTIQWHMFNITKYMYRHGDRRKDTQKSGERFRISISRTQYPPCSFWMFVCVMYVYVGRKSDRWNKVNELKITQKRHTHYTCISNKQTETKIHRRRDRNIHTLTYTFLSTQLTN